jgi:hypothetical protein
MFSSKNNDNLIENESINVYQSVLISMLIIHIPGLFSFLSKISLYCLRFIFLNYSVDDIFYDWTKGYSKIDCIMKLYTRMFFENDLYNLFISLIIILLCLLIYDLTKQTSKSFKTSEEIRNILVKIK